MMIMTNANEVRQNRLQAAFFLIDIPSAHSKRLRDSFNTLEFLFYRQPFCLCAAEFQAQAPSEEHNTAWITYRVVAYRVNLDIG